MQILDRERETALTPLWRMPFRPLFLAAAAWSCICLSLWLAVLLGIQLPALRAGFAWHVHEMLFGFAGAVVVGFITTASQNWTGLRAPSGAPLVVMSGLWLLARLGYGLNAVPPWLPVIPEAGFFLFAALLVGRRLLAMRQWRNLFVIPALVALAVLSALHWLMPEWQRRIGVLTLLLVVSLILVFGGRVVPFFTARRYQMRPRDKIPVLEIGTHTCALVLLLLVAFGLPRAAWGLLALALGILQLLRCSRWHVSRIWREPLLWSLHLSYWMVVIGLFMASLAWPGIAPALESGALHAFAVGGIGGMILAMISRVSLGHSGRQLRAPSVMPLAFAALLLAALARVFWAPATAAYILAVAAWILGYGLFLVCYTPILTAPRADGQAG
ncbi:NnrS family protein [Microbulbifer rhizosphaerae]|nr:NnrS family protein [Microbulbifer rhizosphaerae]